MPRIFDNIELELLPHLRHSLDVSLRADFCVGYFNLRGWKAIDDLVGRWQGGPGSNCRVLVGMQRLPEDDLQRQLSLVADDQGVDNARALQLKREMAESFRRQLVIGAPTNADEAGLRRLREQLVRRQVEIRLFLHHPLHAKLYLAYRDDPINPRVAFVGSSNLTLSGLSKQGELNLDVLDDDAARKLERWFADRWNDRWSVDITDDLADILGESWARDEPVSPYLIYLKMAYHLSQEARAGLAEFTLPREFTDRLLDFQVAAVKIAAHHLNKRGGVLIGDVVGLGKTLMGTALARTFQDDQATETLVICPKSLEPMWRDYLDRFRLIGTVVPLSVVQRQLPDLRRYRVVLIDESHNLRNPESKRYRAIKDYIERNGSRCILLTATPYNKSYRDLSAQLRLFVPDDQVLEIRPERQIAAMGETEFIRQFQCPLRSIAAFEHSEFADDWRELMRLYMVRRTRGFIEANYAATDAEGGRPFLTFSDGRRFFFPKRLPKNAAFNIDDQDPNDQYARLYGEDVVHRIEHLCLPRYGLGNYVAKRPIPAPTSTETAQLKNLGRAGKRISSRKRGAYARKMGDGARGMRRVLGRRPRCPRNSAARPTRPVAIVLLQLVTPGEMLTP